MSSTTIAQLAGCLRDLFTTQADELGRRSGFVRRRSKLTGAKFVQALVFGWLGQPGARRSELAQSAARVGVLITAQGVQARLTEAAAEFLRQMLERAVQRAVLGNPLAIPLLQRFSAVELQDSTTIPLPAALRAVWAGGSGPAALKVQTRWDVLRGALHLELRPGREHDQRAPDAQDEALPRGALHLADLGYFDLARLARLAGRGVYWLLRLRVQTHLYADPHYPDDAAALGPATTPGGGYTLLALLCRQRRQTQPPEGLALHVCLGARQRLPCRLLALRVPPREARRRRRRLRQEATRKAQALSPTQLALAGWWVLVTNVPSQLLTLREAFVLYRVRWQVELLFKLWKDAAKLDEWRSRTPHAILCEVYAKLLAVLVQHWTVVVCQAGYPDRSWVKAAQAVRNEAAHLAAALQDARFLERALEGLRRILATCRMSKRKKVPSTWQRLLASAPLTYGPSP